MKILNDEKGEASETVALTLSDAVNADLGVQKTATLTILDDESAWQVNVKAEVVGEQWGLGGVALEPVNIKLTASVLNPPWDGYGYTIVGPFWERPPEPTTWAVEVFYSETDPEPTGVAEPGTDYTISLAEFDPPSSPLAAMSFWGLKQGYWTIIAKPFVTYNNGAGGQKWWGEGVAKMMLMTTQKADPFVFKSKPNTALAIGNEPREQRGGVCEVLVSWEQEYTAPDGVENVKWYSIFGGGKPVPMGTGKTVTWSDNLMGKWEVYCTGTKDGKPWESEKRWVVVGEVESTAFSLAPGGEYWRDVDNKLWIWSPKFPKDKAKAAVLMSGTIGVKAGSPALTTFKWGFVQSVKADIKTVHAYTDKYAAIWDSPAGTTVTIPKAMIGQSVPEGAIDVTAEGNILYRSGTELGIPNNTEDTPFIPPVGRSLAKVWKVHPMTMIKERIVSLDSTGKLSYHAYSIQQDWSAKYWYQLYQVVYLPRTLQFVPVTQWNWQLSLDTKDMVNAWSVTADKAATIPRSQLPQPSLASASFVDPLPSEDTQVVTKPGIK